MRYLVDGYNLMFVSKEHQPFRKGKTLEQCRRILLKKLAAFAASRRESVTVVFDGEGGGGGGRLGNVEVFFTRVKGGADAQIIRRVEEQSNRKTLAVVSSDREVAEAAKRLGAVSIRSGAFMQQVEAIGGPGEPDPKQATPDDAETEFWLGIFGDEEDR